MCPQGTIFLCVGVGVTISRALSAPSNRIQLFSTYMRFCRFVVADGSSSFAVLPDVVLQTVERRRDGSSGHDPTDDDRPSRRGRAAGACQ